MNAAVEAKCCPLNVVEAVRRAWFGVEVEALDYLWGTHGSALEGPAVGYPLTYMVGVAHALADKAGEVPADEIHVWLGRLRAALFLGRALEPRPSVL